MPFYVIVVRTSIELVDPEAFEAPDLVTAIEEMRSAARELWKEEIMHGHNRRNWHVELRDLRGDVLASVRLADAAREAD